MPHTEEVLLGVGLAHAGELYPLPQQAQRVVPLHDLQHSRPPERPRQSSSSASVPLLEALSLPRSPLFFSFTR